MSHRRVNFEKRAGARNFTGNDKSDLPNDRHDSARVSLLFLRRGVWRFFRYSDGILATYTRVDSAPVYNHHLRNTVAARRRAGKRQLRESRNITYKPLSEALQNNRSIPFLGNFLFFILEDLIGGIKIKNFIRNAKVDRFGFSKPREINRYRFHEKF